MKLRGIVFSLVLVAGLASLSMSLNAQSLLGSGTPLRHSREHHLNTLRPDVHTSDPYNKGQELRFRRIRPLSHLWRRIRGWHQPDERHSAGMESGCRRLRQAIWVFPRYRGSGYHNTVWAVGSLQGRRTLLPLRVQRCIAAIRPCSNFDSDSTPRRRRTPRLLFPCAGRPICGHHGCRLRLVPQPLRTQGCVSHGQLQHARICRPECCVGVLF